ncbi:MAG: GAF domain-containing protein [bacterium]
MNCDYDLMTRQMVGFAETDPHYIPLLANVSALLFQSMEDLNWAGFYLMRGGRLVLGPFQGQTACIHIPLGKGVCGTAALSNKTLRIANVHEFEGHIACDSRSQSEIVIPLRDPDGKVIGVLDMDSPLEARFSGADQAGLEQLCRLLETVISWT